MSPARFLNRRAAGRQLAFALGAYAHKANVMVLALPRGGVPVAGEVAAALDAPLDVLVVRKLGLPGHEEFAMGAVASGGIRVFNPEVVEHFGVSPASVKRVTELEMSELARREEAYRDGTSFPVVAGLTVILVDDGLATGATMSAAVASVRAMRPARVVVAVPVASRDAMRVLRAAADECLCLLEPEPFYGVGFWYDDFSQTTDHEVREILAAARMRRLPTVVPS